MNTAKTFIETTLKTTDEAIKTANEIERLESAVKEMKNQLKEFVDHYGPVETDDVIWDYSTSTSWRFEPEKLKEVAQNIALEGKNPWEYLGLPAAKLRTLEWDESFLNGIGKKSESRRFSSRKK